MRGLRPVEAARLEPLLARLDRRGFLRCLGLAAGAGLLPAGCSAPEFEPPPGLALSTLTPRTYAVLNAASERIVGERGAGAIRAGEIDPAARADDFFASSPALAPRVQQALLALEFAIPPLTGNFASFTALDAEARDDVLDALVRSRFALPRQLFNAVRTFAVIGFYGSRASRTQCGYPERLGQGEPGIAAAMTYPDDPDFPAARPRG